MMLNWFCVFSICFQCLTFTGLSSTDDSQRPSKPSNFRIISTSWTSFNVSWKKPTSGTVTYYHIKLYNPKGERTTSYSSKTYFVATDLKPATLYTVQIFAGNNQKESAVPLERSVSTRSDPPAPDAPKILNEGGITVWQNVFNLTWSTPNGRGLPITSYIVWYRKSSFQGPPRDLSKFATVPFGRNYLVIPLQWGKLYQWAVLAENEFKSSGFSPNSIISFSVTKGPQGRSSKVPPVCQDILTYQNTLSPFGTSHPYYETEKDVIQNVFNATTISFHMCSETAQWFLCAKYFPERNQRTGMRIPPCRSYCIQSKQQINQCVYGNKRVLNCKDFPSFNPRTKSNCLNGPRNVSISSPCPFETTGGEDYGVLEWPETRRGMKVRLPCPYGPESKYVSRKCLISGLWGPVALKSCKIRPSEIQQALNNLSKIVITEKNVVKVSKKLLDITKSVDALESNDVNKVAGILEDIVENGNNTLPSVGFEVTSIVSNLVQANESSLKKAQKESKASTRIVNSLEKFTELVPLTNQDHYEVQTENVKIEAIDVNPRQYSGITIGSSTKAMASISLPDSVFSSTYETGEATKRIAFIAYYKSSLFRTKQLFDDATHSMEVNSHVLSASVKGMEIKNLSSPVVSSFHHVQAVKEGAPLCVYWDFQAREGLGAWSKKGCLVASHDSEKTVCHCDHMTNFAMLMDIESSKSKVYAQDTKHEVALSLITYIGCGVSAVGLTLTLITLLAFRELRGKTPNRILISLCLSLLLVLLVFLFGAERTDVVWLCRGVAVLLHYFILTTFAWMAVEALNMYLLFVKVMPTKTTRFFFKSSILAWGTPGVIVAITVAIAKDEYGGEYLCRISGIPFVVAFLLPVMLIILFNFLIFILVQRSLSSSTSVLTADKRSAGRQNLRRGSAITVLLGLTWAFGIFAVKDAKLVFQYLFCIFNAFQGFLIFLFYCLLQPALRRRWHHCLTGKEEPAKCDAKVSRSSWYAQNMLERSRGRSSTNGTSSNKPSTEPILGTKV